MEKGENEPNSGYLTKGLKMLGKFSQNAPGI